MAWRRELTDGFETGLPGNILHVEDGLNGVKNGSIYSMYALSHYSYITSMGVFAAVGRNGGYAFCSNTSISGGTSGRAHSLRYTLNSASRNITLRIYLNSLVGYVATFMPVKFGNGYISVNPTAQTVSLVWTTPSITITTGPLDLVANWLCIEVKIKINGTGSLLTLRVNGQDIGTNSTADLGTDAIPYVEYGQPVYPLAVAKFYLDDIAINVGDLADVVPWCGLCTRIVADLPVADSASINAWTPSTGTSRFAIVDDIPQKWTGTLPYIASGVLGDKQAMKLKTRAELGVPANSVIKAVSLFATAQDGTAMGAGCKPIVTKSDAANPVVYAAWDVGGTPNPNVPGTANYTGMMKMLSGGEDPLNTGQALSWAEFDKLLIGLESIIP